MAGKNLSEPVIVPGDASPMRALVIHNPNAGDGEPVSKNLSRAFRCADFDAKFVGHKNVEKIARGLEAEPDLVVVVGGDGTVGSLLEFLPLLTMPILILPSGTANNIASSLGIRQRPIDLVGSLSTLGVRSLDVGALVGSLGARNFLESIGFGLFATTMDIEVEGRSAQKRLRRARLEIATRLAALEPHRAIIKVDGETVADDEFLLVEVTSIGFVGPALELATDVRPDDRRLDVITLDVSRRQAMIDWLHDPVGQPPTNARRGNRIAIESAARFRIDDAEIKTGSKKVRIEATTGDASLQVLVPA